MNEVANLYKNGKLRDVEFDKNGFMVKQYKGVAIPKEAENVCSYIYSLMPRIKITDLLVEVDKMTNFSDQFVDLKTGQPAKDRKVLLSAILADGINLGLQGMSNACPDITINQLRTVSDWYIRDECYIKALA